MRDIICDLIVLRNIYHSNYIIQFSEILTTFPQLVFIIFVLNEKNSVLVNKIVYLEITNT